jgi:hypothetical protein
MLVRLCSKQSVQIHSARSFRTRLFHSRLHRGHLQKRQLMQWKCHPFNLFDRPRRLITLTDSEVRFSLVTLQDELIHPFVVFLTEIAESILDPAIGTWRKRQC